MNDTLMPQRSLWRFSLRELLLLMLAAAAFVAWGILLYERSQRFHPSSLFEFAPYWREDIQIALSEIGENRSSTLPFAVTSADGPSAHRSESYSFPLAVASSDAFLKAFRSRMRQRLASAGYKILGEAAGNAGASQVTVMSYRLGARVGAVHICKLKNGNDQESVVITMHEEGAWRGSFGVGVSAGS